MGALVVACCMDVRSNLWESVLGFCLMGPENWHLAYLLSRPLSHGSHTSCELAGSLSHVAYLDCMKVWKSVILSPLVFPDESLQRSLCCRLVCSVEFPIFSSLHLL